MRTGGLVPSATRVAMYAALKGRERRCGRWIQRGRQTVYVGRRADAAGLLLYREGLLCRQFGGALDLFAVLICGTWGRLTLSGVMYENLESIGG